MRPVLLLAALLALTTTALALDTSTRPIGPVLTWDGDDLDRFDDGWVHLKIIEGMDVTLTGKRFVAADRQDLSALNAILAGALEIRRTFSGDREHFKALKARGEAASGRPGPDLSLWYDVRLPAGKASLATAINDLNAQDTVEIAHPAPVCELAVIRSEANEARMLPTPDFTHLQDYLYDTPTGLNAPAAWAHPGGDGLGMRFIDVELGWVHTHEDFNPFNQFYSSGEIDPSYHDHGTAVLGEVIGTDNAYGVTGFAHKAEWGTVAITVDEWPTVPHYFLEAAEALRPGDVWLIELQMYPPDRGATPMEWLQVNFDAIWTSCWSLGVVCIEAGANGSQNLDASHWDGVFDREVRDSGAIMVGAGTPTGRVAEWFTNYGSRMDVHAWGSEIVTTGYGDLQGGAETAWYTAQFGGTSGASPMITGSSLCLQGIHKAAYGVPMTPSELRQVLNETGIAHLDPSSEIGPRPDLEAAVDQVLGTTGVTPGTRASGLQLTSAMTPFDTSTEIRFKQARQESARLTIFDVAGRRVRTIDMPVAGAGPRSIQWDGHDASGREASSGVYLFRLESGREEASGRVVKLR